MRKKFALLLEEEMNKNEDIYLITADLGFGILDACREKFTDRSYNTGAAEQLMVGAAIGLAESNKIPVCYSITPFLLYRPFEFLRNYVSYENIPVKLVGSGRDKDYSHDGISHWAEDDEIVLKALPNIEIFKPNSLKELEDCWDEFINTKQPCYLNLKRSI
jgi:transketolase